MIVPAIIVIVQYGIRRIMGQGDSISMDHLLPKSILLQGYAYEANCPNWDSPFQRPNGFFFLEPSFVSRFTASATIVELGLFRCPLFVLLMIAATAGAGSTGPDLASPWPILKLTREYGG
jgi:hypothetical protein